jgi:hypothetical protein
MWVRPDHQFAHSTTARQGLRPEPRATSRCISKQHENAQDTAAGLDEGRTLFGRFGTDEATLPRYCDYYSFMSLADFMTWIQKDDGSEPGISYSRR